MALFRSKKKIIAALLKENRNLKAENKRLVDLCDLKDSYFMELMADGLRHKSPLAAKHMAHRRDFLKKKR